MWKPLLRGVSLPCGSGRRLQNCSAATEHARLRALELPYKIWPGNVAQMNDTEDIILSKLAGGAAVSVERALLVLSGLSTEEEISLYERKIDDIFSRFLKKLPEWENPRKFAAGPDSSVWCTPPYLHESIAKSLFDYLWTSKPKRFEECFLLAGAVDSQLDPDVNRTVGNCVGLTSLYSVLGLKAGLNLSVVANSDHMLGRLRIGSRIIDMDHTDPLGFGCGMGKDFREYPLASILANVLNSRGLSREKQGDRAGAASDYRKAALVNPEYANARNNMGNSQFWEENYEAAVSDYSEAIRLDPFFKEAWFNRGIAYQKLGRGKEAREDYREALRIDPCFSECLRWLELLDQAENSDPAKVRP